MLGGGVGGGGQGATVRTEASFPYIRVLAIYD